MFRPLLIASGIFGIAGMAAATAEYAPAGEFAAAGVSDASTAAAEPGTQVPTQVPAWVTERRAQLGAQPTAPEAPAVPLPPATPGTPAMVPAPTYQTTVTPVQSTAAVNPPPLPVAPTGPEVPAMVTARPDMPAPRTTPDWVIEQRGHAAAHPMPLEKPGMPTRPAEPEWVGKRPNPPASPQRPAPPEKPLASTAEASERPTVPARPQPPARPDMHAKVPVVSTAPFVPRVPPVAFNPAIRSGHLAAPVRWGAIPAYPGWGRAPHNGWGNNGWMPWGNSWGGNNWMPWGNSWGGNNWMPWGNSWGGSDWNNSYGDGWGDGWGNTSGDASGDAAGDIDFSFAMSGRAKGDMRGHGQGSGYGDGYGRGYGRQGYYHPQAFPPVGMLPQQQAVPEAVEPQLPPDTDGDGVTDVIDLCPESAEAAVVDALGCAETTRIVLRGVNFKTDSDELTEESLTILDAVSATLAANPDIRVMVAGHTDSDGEDAYNKDLSQRRAQTVVDYLAKHGVARDNMIAKGFGEEKPIAANDSAEGKAQNRRVELDRL